MEPRALAAEALVRDARADAVPLLAERARDGDRDAFQSLYRALGPLVHGLLIARVPPADVEDLVQEVFLAAWRRILELRDTQRVAAWLCGIARRRAADFHRARGPAWEALPEELPAPAGDADTRADVARVLAALRSLPETYRESLALRLVEGLDGASIAEAVGLTPESVRVHLARGMKLLREKLEREGRR